MRDSIKSFTEIQREYTNWIPLINWMGYCIVKKIKFVVRMNMKKACIWLSFFLLANHSS